MVFQSSVLFTHFCLSLLNSLSLISLCQCVCVFTVCPSNHAFCSKGRSFLHFPHLMSEHQELKQSPRGSLQMIGFLFKLEEFPHLWQNNGYRFITKFQKFSIKIYFYFHHIDHWTLTFLQCFFWWPSLNKGFGACVCPLHLCSKENLSHPSS